MIADHIRSGLMLMSDGVVPGNEGGGYILRRLLRRSIRAMRLLGVEEPTLRQLFAASRDAMKAAYPVVEIEYARIERLAVQEEESFLHTLASGTTILDLAVARTKSAGAAQLSSDTAFLLHDTYGFPIDLTLEIAEEAGLSIDRGGFDALMQRQRERAKADAKAKKKQLADVSVYSEYRAQGETLFTGYETLVTESRVLGLLVDGHQVQSANAGQTAEVVLAETSLYAESGGQDADVGTIIGPGYELDVIDVQKPVKGLVSHTVEVRSGTVAVGDPATTLVDEIYRRGANRAHSATHLVHAALRQILGPEAHQAGSYNKPDSCASTSRGARRSRPRTRSEIEEIANRAITDDLEVTTRIMPLDDARSLGAMALFGEKYGDEVRVVRIGDTNWSLELCAWHACRPLLGRRAHRPRRGVVGGGAESPRRGTRRARGLRGPPLGPHHPRHAHRGAEDPARSARRADRLAVGRAQGRGAPDRAVRERSAARTGAGAGRDRRRAGDYDVVWAVNGSEAIDDLRALATTVSGRLPATGSNVVVEVSVVDGRANTVVKTTNGGGTSFSAKAALDTINAITGGRGGGSADLAQGGGGDPTKLEGGAGGIHPPTPGAVKPGVRLAVDVGTVRIGVAGATRPGTLASPVETVARGDGDVERVAGIAAELAAFVVYVGLPVSLAGRTTASTDDALGFAARLATSVGVEVRMLDERLTTVAAQAQLHASGRDSRRGRSVRRPDSRQYPLGARARRRTSRRNASGAPHRGRSWHRLTGERWRTTAAGGPVRSAAGRRRPQAGGAR